MDLKCFKAYDIRGRLGDELNIEIAYRIGRAFANFLNPRQVVLGGDIRATSEELKLALAKGIIDEGASVIDIGTTGTEEVYFAVQHLKVDGGIEVTASHNPIDYNGMKLVKDMSKPISSDSGLLEIKRLAESIELPCSVNELKTYINDLPEEQYEQRTLENEFASYLLKYIETDNIKPLKLVVNSGNGAAGKMVDVIEERFNALNIPIEFIKVHHDPDPTFPNGIPNPILPENRASTSKAVIESNADFGIAWDGDFDRCFLFDEKGNFIEGYYIVGLLAEAFLAKEEHGKIIHDPRLTWNTLDIVESNSGVAIQTKTGHAFIKERMRKEDAIYGGEMSAHHYFRDFGYCDSGMIPWLLIAELVCKKNQALSSLVNNRIQKFPSPGEINFKVGDVKSTIEKIESEYNQQVLNIDRTDGISLEFEDWRFNLRGSNTEPVIRLNLETKGDIILMQEKTKELSNLIERIDS